MADLRPTIWIWRRIKECRGFVVRLSNDKRPNSVVTYIISVPSAKVLLFNEEKLSLRCFRHVYCSMRECDVGYCQSVQRANKWTVRTHLVTFELLLRSMIGNVICMPTNQKQTMIIEARVDMLFICLCLPLLT